MPLTVSYQELDVKLKEFYVEHLEKKCMEHRDTVAGCSKRRAKPVELNLVKFQVTTFIEKVLLGVLQWYMPRELGCLANLWLEENWGPDFEEWKVPLQTSKKMALGCLLTQKRWSSRDFYGNVLTKNHVHKLKAMRVLGFKKRKPTRKLRRRGYSDKGTLRPFHLVPIVLNYKTLKTDEEILEEERQKAEKISQFLSEIEERLLLEDIS